MNLYRYCNSNPASFVDVTGEDAVVLTILLLLAAGVIVYEALDATVWNPNVNPFHPANLLPSVPGGYKPEVLPPLDLSFPAIPNDRPLIVPGPMIDDAELADIILDEFQATIPGLDVLIDIFPVVERDFFQNIVCTEGKKDSETSEYYKKGFACRERLLIFRDQVSGWCIDGCLSLYIGGCRDLDQDFPGNIDSFQMMEEIYKYCEEIGKPNGGRWR